MREEAAEILFRGVERSEAVPGRPGQSYLYFPSLDVGTYTVQVRMTCEIAPLRPGRADVKVLEINPGVLDKLTKKLEYQKDPRELIDSTAQVELIWREQGKTSGLRVVQCAQQKFKLLVPWWFPVPGQVIEGLIRPFIQAAVKGSQEGVFKALRERSSQFSATRQGSMA